MFNILKIILTKDHCLKESIKGEIQRKKLTDILMDPGFGAIRRFENLK